MLMSSTLTLLSLDKVDINILLLKLEDIGVKSKLHNWIKSFITERTQSVVVKEYNSKAVNVTSGVPQGSVLGPPLKKSMSGLRETTWNSTA